MTAIDQLKNHWMPFSSNHDFKQNPRIISKAKGLELWDEKGNRLIDGSSGLFCVALGHGREEIAAAVNEQLLTLDYCSPFQVGQSKSFELAARLAKILPESIEHVFFTNSGSESVDTAMKIAMAYHHCRGETHRSQFISRERAYHGVNVGGTSLSGMIKNREIYNNMSLGVLHMRHTWNAEERFVRGQPQKGVELADDLQRFTQLIGGNNIAAVFIEPIAGSTGVLVPPQGYLERLREICDQHGILLIFDEVITGFGRTGKPFASDSFGVIPDIITLAKAMTNGSMPMGAVAVSEKIYNTMVEERPGKAVEMFHGYTYSGHPVCCAAGLATLDIFEKENVFEAVKEMAPYFIQKVFSTLSDVDVITDIRTYGMLAGVDVKSVPGAPGAAGLAAAKKMFHNGMHIKFTGDCGIISPPLVSTKSDIDEVCEKFRASLV